MIDTTNLDSTQLLDELQQIDHEIEMAPWRARFIKHLINPIYIGSLAGANLFFSVFLAAEYVGDIIS